MLWPSFLTDATLGYDVNSIMLTNKAMFYYINYWNFKNELLSISETNKIYTFWRKIKENFPGVWVLTVPWVAKSGRTRVWGATGTKSVCGAFGDINLTTGPKVEPVAWTAWVATSFTGVLICRNWLGLPAAMKKVKLIFQNNARDRTVNKKRKGRCFKLSSPNQWCWSQSHGPSARECNKYQPSCALEQWVQWAKRYKNQSSRHIYTYTKWGVSLILTSFPENLLEEKPSFCIFCFNSINCKRSQKLASGL